MSRQTTYERLLAAQRNLGDRVALSTLLIQLQYAAPDTIDAAPVDEDKGLGDAFADGWNAFVGVLFGIAFVLAIAAPFLVVALIVCALGWMIMRRLNRRRDHLRNRHEPLDPPRTEASAAVQQPVDAGTSPGGGRSGDDI